MTGGIPMTAIRDGQMLPVQVDGEDVLVCRVDGEFFAIANRCSHASQALHTGRLRGYEIVCPLHGARFDVRDGRCLRAPAREGVRTYRVVIDAGRVNVSIGSGQLR